MTTFTQVVYTLCSVVPISLLSLLGLAFFPVNPQTLDRCLLYIMYVKKDRGGTRKAMGASGRYIQAQQNRYNKQDGLRLSFLLSLLPPPPLPLPHLYCVCIFQSLLALWPLDRCVEMQFCTCCPISLKLQPDGTFIFVLVCSSLDFFSHMH